LQISSLVTPSSKSIFVDGDYTYWGLEINGQHYSIFDNGTADGRLEFNETHKQ
jgi:hypothetical protein